MLQTNKKVCTKLKNKQKRFCLFVCLLPKRLETNKQKEYKTVEKEKQKRNKNQTKPSRKQTKRRQNKTKKNNKRDLTRSSCLIAKNAVFSSSKSISPEPSLSIFLNASSATSNPFRNLKNSADCPFTSCPKKTSDRCCN